MSCREFKTASYPKGISNFHAVCSTGHEGKVSPSTPLRIDDFVHFIPLLLTIKCCLKPKHMEIDFIGIIGMKIFSCKTFLWLCSSYIVDICQLFVRQVHGALSA